MTTDTKLSKLLSKNKAQKSKILELEENLRAIQNGEVDALVVAGPSGNRIFTLQSNEQPYRELVEVMNEGALTVSPDGIILYSNARFEAMTRVRHGKLVGSDFRSHIRPESRLVVQALLERSKLTPSTAEVVLNVTEQVVLPVQLSVSAIQLVGTDGFCIIATDLSAHKQNAILVQHQEWLGTLLSVLPIPLVLLDSNLIGFTFINAKATEVLEGIIDKEKNETLAPILLIFENAAGDTLEIRDILEKIERGQRAVGFETILTTRTKKIPVLLFSQTIPAMHGREPARLLMFQDISTIKAAQLELSQALRGRDQFMAALSHELRTPIHVILGWVQTLLSNPLDESIRNQALDTINRNAEIQRDLIENLLDMSRIVTGSLIIETKPHDLNVIVRGCVTSLELKANEKSIQISLELEEETTIVSVDESRIQQLISNLVQNAIKFTPANGIITVSVAKDQKGKVAFVEIKDNGQGIDPEFLPYIFEQFKQENMSTSRTFGGLGLGLAICKTIIEQHHGKIKATSKGTGKGSTFIIQLPLAAQSKIPIAKVLAESKVEDFKGLRLLLVDDSEDNLVLFRTWLKNSGLEIKTLNSAIEVIATLASFKPDVLLSDISMPGEDGYTLIAKVRALSVANGSKIPAGALTANARVEDRDQALAAGFNLHIPKPVTRNGLFEAIRLLKEIGNQVKS